MTLVDEVRERAAWVADQAERVVIDRDAIPDYAASLPAPAGVSDLDPETHRRDRSAEERAAFVLTLNAINFGSGWFPTLRKRPGRSGYYTVALGLRNRFDAYGPWDAAELRRITPAELAEVLCQDPGHELMQHFARSLNDLGDHIEADHEGRFRGPVQAAGSAALTLVDELAVWDCFTDASIYRGRRVPFFKRAQITAADLNASGVASFDDLGRLTLFADNLVPHVMRLDGVLWFAPDLVTRIERGYLVERGSIDEIEIRAGAVHAAELIAVHRKDLPPHLIDLVLWTRGGGPQYKAVPRPRCRSTAY